MVMEKTNCSMDLGFHSALIEEKEVGRKNKTSRRWENPRVTAKGVAKTISI